MQLTHYQCKILRYIRKPKPVKKVLEKFHFANLYDFSATLYCDNKLLYIYEQEPIYDDTLIQASHAAIAELEVRKDKHFQAYVPITISLIALAKSFSEELFWLWQQLMQLLK